MIKEQMKKIRRDEENRRIEIEAEKERRESEKEERAR